MARKPKTRRSVSLRGQTYQRLKDYCEPRGLAISGYLEQLIDAAMTREGVALRELEPRAEPEQPVAAPFAGAHFTF